MIHEEAGRGKTIFVTTHFMEEAEYCHRISIMRAGAVIALDGPTALKRRFGKESVHDVFIELVAEGGER